MVKCAVDAVTTVVSRRKCRSEKCNTVLFLQVLLFPHSNSSVASHVCDFSDGRCDDALNNWRMKCWKPVVLGKIRFLVLERQQLEVKGCAQLEGLGSGVLVATAMFSSPAPLTYVRLRVLPVFRQFIAVVDSLLLVFIIPQDTR